MAIFNNARWHGLLLGLICIVGVSACGFQLRGLADLSFDKLYMQGQSLTISTSLKKQLAINGVKVVSTPEEAQLLLEMLSESTEDRILSLSGAGKVREYELFYRVHFRVRDAASDLWGPSQTVENRRDFSYDDTQLLAKQFEEARLYEDMRADAVREILRRLVVQKPKAAAKEAASAEPDAVVKPVEQ
jgi:LPS-assembly lipoprotein